MYYWYLSATEGWVLVLTVKMLSQASCCGRETARETNTERHPKRQGERHPLTQKVRQQYRESLSHSNLLWACMQHLSLLCQWAMLLLPAEVTCGEGLMQSLRSNCECLGLAPPQADLFYFSGAMHGCSWCLTGFLGQWYSFIRLFLNLLLWMMRSFRTNNLKDYIRWKISVCFMWFKKKIHLL